MTGPTSGFRASPPHFRDFGKLVLGCIKAKFDNPIFVGENACRDLIPYCATDSNFKTYFETFFENVEHFLADRSMGRENVRGFPVFYLWGGSKFF
jgi:hypothetical protein